MNPSTRVAAAKQREIEARRLADAASADYRREVAEAVAEWKASGHSLRRCAEKLGITEGALRDLLRPEGATRRRARRSASPGAGTPPNDGEQGPGTSTYPA